MNELQIIKMTAGDASAELGRRGLRSVDPITLTIERRGNLLMTARAACRARVVAEGFSDAGIDAMIAKARSEAASEAE